MNGVINKNEWVTDMFSNMDETKKHSKWKESNKKTTFLAISTYINSVKIKLLGMSLQMIVFQGLLVNVT